MKIRLFIAIWFMTIHMPSYGQWANVFPNNESFGSCFATNPDTCFVSGGSIIYRTTNGGSSWDSMQTVFTTSWFNDIYFPSANVGYACGGTNFGTHRLIIAKTTNGGQSWDSITSNAFGWAYEFYDTFCPNDSVAFFGGDYFVKTTDGGQSFSMITLPFYGIIDALYFFDSNNGLVATAEYVNTSKSIYRIASTSDAGNSWTITHVDSTNISGLEGSKRIHAIDFRDANNGFAVGDNGTLLHTSNGGLNWSAQILANDSTHLKDINFSKNSLRGYIAAAKYTGSNNWQGRIYRTDDGGSTWQENFNTAAEGVYSISMCSDDVVYAAGYGPVFKTINGGVGMQDYFKEKNEIRIYPNPLTSSSILQLNTQLKNAEVVIYDMLGKEMVRKKMDGDRMEIEKGSLESGIYFVRVSTEERQYVQKIIVE